MHMSPLRRDTVSLVTIEPMLDWSSSLTLQRIFVDPFPTGKYCHLKLWCGVVLLLLKKKNSINFFKYYVASKKLLTSKIFSKPYWPTLDDLHPGRIYLQLSSTYQICQIYQRILWKITLLEVCQQLVIL